MIKYTVILSKEFSPNLAGVDKSTKVTRGKPPDAEGEGVPLQYLEFV